jgi:hypothetical protein
VNLYHIRKDLGLNKQAIKKKFYRWHFRDNTPETNRVAEMLERRANWYRIEELALILKYNLLDEDLYIVSHPEQFTTYQGGQSIVVNAAQRRVDHHWELVERFNELRLKAIGE